MSNPLTQSYTKSSLAQKFDIEIRKDHLKKFYERSVYIYES